MFILIEQHRPTVYEKQHQIVGLSYHILVHHCTLVFYRKILENTLKRLQDNLIKTIRPMGICKSCRQRLY